MNTSRLDRGLYLLQLRNDAGDAITRKFVK
ncbi:MAG: hypothetical protein LBB64_03515 [Dysgonamonadaceae bacterium]|nr:hypothetical protein [Dysgonamonadaceae bacterium]